MAKQTYYLAEEFDRKGDPTGELQIKISKPSDPVTIKDFKSETLKQEAKEKAEKEAQEKNNKTTTLLYIAGGISILYLILKK